LILNKYLIHMRFIYTSYMSLIYILIYTSYIGI